MASFWDMISGNEAAMQQINPNYGVPQQFVRDSALNALGQIGGLLMAAGQPVDPAVRAQLLGQIGGVGGGMTTDIYKAAQARLMGSQLQEQMSEQRENERIRTQMADPAKFKAQYGFDPSGLGVEDVRSALRQITISKATQDPLKLAARQAAAEILGTGSPAAVPATTTEAKQVADVATAPQGAGAAAGVPQANLSDMATTYRRLASDPRIARGDPALAKTYADLATALEDKASLAGRTTEAQERAKLPFELVQTTDAEGRTIFVPKAQMLNGGAPVSQTPAEAKAAEKKAIGAVEKQSLLPKAENAFLVANRKAADIEARAKEAIEQTKGTTTGLPGAIFGNVPGTKAYDLRETIKTIVANIGFDELQAMRDASPTGGALGQVAIKEIEFLQAARGSLNPNQSEAQLRKNLNDFLKGMEQLKEERRRAFKADFGRDPGEASGGFRVLNATPPQQRP